MTPPAVQVSWRTTEKYKLIRRRENVRGMSNVPAMSPHLPLIKLRMISSQLALSNSARSLFSIAPPVNCLNIIGMVVAPGSSHASRIDVVGHDVVVVGELYTAECALPVLFDNLTVEQPPHLRVGAEFPVSPGMLGVFNPLHT